MDLPNRASRGTDEAAGVGWREKAGTGWVLGRSTILAPLVGNGRLRYFFALVALIPVFSILFSHPQFNYFTPAAPAPTRAYAAAALGKLSVTAEVVLAGATVRFLGDWSNPTVSCSATRRVVLESTLSYVPARAKPGPPRFVSSRKIGHVVNCPQAGHGLDFSYLAKSVQLACPGGRWRPGNYDLMATVIVAGAGGTPTEGALSAEAELSSTQEVPCGAQHQSSRTTG